MKEKVRYIFNAMDLISMVQIHTVFIHPNSCHYLKPAHYLLMYYDIISNYAEIFLQNLSSKPEFSLNYFR